MRALLCLVLTSILILVSTLSRADFCDSEFTIKKISAEGSSLKTVPENKVIQTLAIGQPNNRFDFSRLRILVWNLHKGLFAGLNKDLNTLTQNADLSLLQEGYLNTEFKDVFCARTEFSWKMAASFWDMKKYLTGVVTASRQIPLSSSFVSSPDTEPMTNTHKMSLVTKYDIPGRSEKLLVINIHGINFRGTNEFKNQISKVGELIAVHTGPVIFAGDFNSRNHARTDYLKTLLASWGLERVDTGYNDRNWLRFLPFDHLFQRGFEVITAKALVDINTSDHKPLYFELKLKP